MLALSLALPSSRPPVGGGGSPPVNTVAPSITGGTAEVTEFSFSGLDGSMFVTEGDAKRVIMHYGPTDVPTLGLWFNTATEVDPGGVTTSQEVSISPVDDENTLALAFANAVNAAGHATAVADSYLVTVTDDYAVARTDASAGSTGVVVEVTTQGGLFPGDTLTCDDGEWDGEDSIARNWQRDQGSGTWVNISGETGTTYVLQAIYAGEFIRCNVTATNGAGSTSEPSNELGPVYAWWVAGGATGAVAAYQAKGVASFAASKVNLANPGVFDAADGSVAPSFDSATGWIFSGSEWLETGIEPEGDWTMLMQVSEIGSGKQVLMGCQTAGEAERFRIYADFSDQCFYGNGSQTAFAPGFVTPGNIGFAGLTAYRNGVSDGSIEGAGYAGAGLDVWIGGANGDGAFAQGSAFRCSAFVIYNNTLDASEVAAVAAAMAAL